jgi:uncharacterized protein (TIGR02145 family)
MIKQCFLMLATASLWAASAAAQDNTEKGVKVGGVVWATRNVDDPGTFAATPGDFGKFYQFNRAQAWGTSGNIADYNAIRHDSTTREWAKANDPCPKGWRLPTADELTALGAAGTRWSNGVDKTWDVAGRWFGSNADKATVENPGEAIFLPAVGFLTRSGDLSEQQKTGVYWSANYRPDAGMSPLKGMRLYFNRDISGVVNSFLLPGYPVRCVCETQK